MNALINSIAQTILKQPPLPPSLSLFLFLPSSLSLFLFLPFFSLSLMKENPFIVHRSISTTVFSHQKILGLSLPLHVQSFIFTIQSCLYPFYIRKKFRAIITSKSYDTFFHPSLNVQFSIAIHFFISFLSNYFFLSFSPLIWIIRPDRLTPIERYISFRIKCHENDIHPLSSSFVPLLSLSLSLCHLTWKYKRVKEKGIKFHWTHHPLDEDEDNKLW